MNHDDLIRRLRELYRKTGAPSYKEAADALEAASRNERRYREALEAIGRLYGCCAECGASDYTYGVNGHAEWCELGAALARIKAAKEQI